MRDLPPAHGANAENRKRRRRFGILVKMAFAFTAVSALAATSEIVAWLSFQGIEKELVEVVHHAVPIMTTAEALAVEATAIANATGTLTTALSETERRTLMTNLAARVHGLMGRLDALGQLNVADNRLAPLRERITTLNTNLKRQSDLVAQRIAINAEARDDASRIGESHKQFLAAVTPRIENTYRSLFSGIKTLVDDLGPAPDTHSDTPHQQEEAREANVRNDMVVLQHRIGRLFNHNVGEILTLLELAAAGNLAAGLLNEAILVTNPAQVHQLRSRFGAVTVSMGSIRLNLATTAENQVLLALSTPMLQYGLGSDNVFDLRLRELDLIEASNAVVSENRRLSEALTLAVDHLLGEARGNADASASAVQTDAATARLVQTVTAGLTILIALLIGWRTVGHRIIGRILALQRAMEAEAAGREIIIPTDGDDEITDMAAALGHFVDRRKTAEAELRAAKDRAEGAFAELKELQQVLIQTEKIAALGGLVAGVAHELNTPVGVCLTAASLLGEKTEELARYFSTGQLRKSAMQDYVAVAEEVTTLIRNNLNRAADLIRVFKQVAVDPSGEQLLFRLREAIDDAIELTADRLNACPQAIQIDCPPTLTLMNFPDALRQVIAILLDNALVHAFPPGTSGTITLTATPTPAKSITLVVADDGVGIPPEDLPKLFDPFFTTRRSHGGIGLGLHMAFNIVSSVLQGRISVDSQPNQGCRFILTLPTNTSRLRSPALESSALCTSP